jgi:two-component system nitrogen regulation response regulator GlnG
MDPADNHSMKDMSQDKSLPLKERRDDIIPLALHFMKLAEDQLGTSAKMLSKEAEEYIRNCEWPGNERELETAIKRACILSDDTRLFAEDFDLKQRSARSIGKFVETRLKGFMRNIKRFESFNLYQMVIPEVERALILMVMKETQGNQIKAAKLLGINRNTLRSKIRKLGIKINSR